MILPDTAKPATVSSEPALNIEQLGSELNSNHSDALRVQQYPSALDLQIFCLARRFSLNASVAEAFAVLVYGGLHK
jgi:hypothetical protein